MFEKLSILKEIFGKYKQEANEYLFKCPKCNHYKNKLSINLIKNTYKCWICDYKGRNLSKLIKRYGSNKHKELWKDETFEPFATISNRKLESKLELPTIFLPLCTPDELPIFANPALTYLDMRGITQFDCLYWKLGISTHKDWYGRIIFPSFGLDGYCNFYTGRSYVGHEIKYKNTAGSKDIIFNQLSIDWSKPITLIEGPIDAIKSGPNSIPLLGSSLNENSLLFEAIVYHCESVYLGLDPDAKKKAERMIEQFLGFDVSVYDMDLQDKDPGELSKQEMNELRSKAKLITQDNKFEYLVKSKLKELK